MVESALDALKNAALYNATADEMQIFPLKFFALKQTNMPVF